MKRAINNRKGDEFGFRMGLKFFIMALVLVFGFYMLFVMLGVEMGVLGALTGEDSGEITWKLQDSYDFSTGEHCEEDCYDKGDIYYSGEARGSDTSDPGKSVIGTLASSNVNYADYNVKCGSHEGVSGDDYDHYCYKDYSCFDSSGWGVCCRAKNVVNAGGYCCPEDYIRYENGKCYPEIVTSHSVWSQQSALITEAKLDYKEVRCSQVDNQEYKGYQEHITVVEDEYFCVKVGTLYYKVHCVDLNPATFEWELQR